MHVPVFLCPAFFTALNFYVMLYLELLAFFNEHLLNKKLLGEVFIPCGISLTLYKDLTL